MYYVENIRNQENFTSLNCVDLATQRGWRQNSKQVWTGSASVGDYGLWRKIADFSGLLAEYLLFWTIVSMFMSLILFLFCIWLVLIAPDAILNILLAC